MKIFKSSLILSCLCAFYWVSCSWIIADASSRANELYVQASLQMMEARTEADNYARIFELYKDSQQKIDLILLDYTDTDVAVRLSAGEIGIWGDSLERFRELGKDLSRLVLAEQDFLACSHFIEEYIRDAPSRYFEQHKKKPEKASALGDIAVGLAKKGQFEQALETADTIRFPYSKVQALLEIAVSLAQAGQTEKVGIVFSKAVSKIGFVGREGNKAEALAEIAAAYRRAGIVPGDVEVALLKDLVQSRKPIESFWVHWDWDRNRRAD